MGQPTPVEMLRIVPENWSCLYGASATVTTCGVKRATILPSVDPLLYNVFQCC